jgi:hypothetical protein
MSNLRPYSMSMDYMQSVICFIYDLLSSRGKTFNAFWFFSASEKLDVVYPVQPCMHGARYWKNKLSVHYFTDITTHV